MSPEQRDSEWENWGDERTIETFELNVRFDGTHLSKIIAAVQVFSILFSNKYCFLVN